MGEAKRRGSLEERKAVAVSRRAEWLGKSVDSRTYGRGTVVDVRNDRVVVRYVSGRRTRRVTYPLTSLVRNNSPRPADPAAPAGAGAEV